MARFSTVFGLSNRQADLDFVDLELSTDTPLYLDPYAIQIRHDEWSELCGDHIRSYFAQLLDALAKSDRERVKHLLSHLHEPNETRLGVSTGESRGRGIGLEKAEMLTTSLIRSKALRTGLLTDISETEMFIHGIGRDTISDLTTNVLRGVLAQYTVEQCTLHRIPTQDVFDIGPIWNIGSGDWEAQPLRLPIHNESLGASHPKIQCETPA
jgi:hypothetical protein